MKFLVRVTGTAVVWADIEVDAESAENALEKVDDGDIDNIAEVSNWEFSEGGNGVDDWSTTGEVYDAEGNELLPQE